MHPHCGDLKVPGAAHSSAQPRDGRRPPHCNAQSCCLSPHCLLGGYIFILLMKSGSSKFFTGPGIFVYSSSLDHYLSPWTPRRPTWSRIIFINIFVFIPFLVITINITIIITINITIIITIIIMPCSKACGFLRLQAALFLTQLRTWRILQSTPVFRPWHFH